MTISGGHWDDARGAFVDGKQCGAHCVDVGRVSFSFGVEQGEIGVPGMWGMRGGLYGTK